MKQFQVCCITEAFVMQSGWYDIICWHDGCHLVQL